MRSKINELLMLFNSFRQRLYRFFSRDDYEESSGMQKPLNEKVLKLFRDYGGTNEFQSIEFFFYTDEQDKANNLAIELSAMGYTVYGADKGSNEQYSLLCGMFFNGIGLSMYGKLERYEIYYVVGVVWILQIIWSHVWLHYFRFGPLEWAWRSLTYWKRQPMKRNIGNKETMAVE